jgi:hypothetical protein
MKNKNKIKTNKLPFSKTTVLAARYESYIVASLLFLFVWFDKDVSAIAILASLSWGGYRLVQNFYIWMAKNEHIMDKKIEYKKLGLDCSSLDEEEDLLEHQDFEDENLDAIY